MYTNYDAGHSQAIAHTHGVSEQPPYHVATHTHEANSYDITFFGALPKIDLNAVRQNCAAAKARLDVAGRDSDFVLKKLIADTEALVERCEKLQNIAAMIAMQPA